ncbi:2-hydroxyacid dehydrogenase [Neptunomonas sp.]|uniref:2-hydroxyacid dehydrogenase n=1 Tax=Neptunomonas sp. TaxID=1971898 RepID=UPI003567D0BA
MTSDLATALPNVLVIWPNRPSQMAHLEATYKLHRLDLCSNPEAMIETIGDSITAVVTTGIKGLSSDLIKRLPNLKIVASSGVGYDSIDVALCSELGIRVTNTPDILTDDVADIAIALMLAQRRGIVLGDRWIREGCWAQQGPMLLTSSIRGKRLGIVGLGRIGKAIAARVEPMGVQIAYFGRRPQADNVYDFKPKLIDLAHWADILVLACPGGEATHHLINAEVLAALGTNGTLINVARGSVVDQQALIDALTTNSIAGAGLDVFTTEPHDGRAFAGLDNVVLYPHHASGTIETRDAMAQLVVDNLEAHFAGRALLTAIN